MKLDPAIAQLFGMLGAAKGQSNEELIDNLQRLSSIAEKELGGSHVIMQNALKSMNVLKGMGG